MTAEIEEPLDAGTLRSMALNLVRLDSVRIAGLSTSCQPFFSLIFFFKTVGYRC